MSVTTCFIFCSYLKPQSSDDEDAAEEEREVLKLQSEKLKGLSMEDFGLEEPTFEVRNMHEQ